MIVNPHAPESYLHDAWSYVRYVVPFLREYKRPAPDSLQVRAAILLDGVADLVEDVETIEKAAALLRRTPSVAGLRSVTWVLESIANVLRRGVDPGDREMLVQARRNLVLIRERR